MLLMPLTSVGNFERVRCVRCSEWLRVTGSGSNGLFFLDFGVPRVQYFELSSTDPHLFRQARLVCYFRRVLPISMELLANL